MRFFAALFCLFLSLQSLAHIRMINPKPRLDVDNLKQNATRTNPCGNQPRGSNPYIYRPNQIVPIELQETINHPGRFVVQFSLSNDLGFDRPENELTRLEDTMSGGLRTLQARMPNIECTTCTLRVVQVMDDQPGELYVHCIDINLRAAAPPPPGGQTDLGSSTPRAPEVPGFGCGLIANTDPSVGGPFQMAALLSLLLLPLTMLILLRLRSRRRYRVATVL